MHGSLVKQKIYSLHFQNSHYSTNDYSKIVKLGTAEMVENAVIRMPVSSWQCNLTSLQNNNNNICDLTKTLLSTHTNAPPLTYNNGTDTLCVAVRVKVKSAESAAQTKLYKLVLSYFFSIKNLISWHFVIVSTLKLGLHHCYYQSKQSSGVCLHFLCWKFCICITRDGRHL